MLHIAGTAAARQLAALLSLSALFLGCAASNYGRGQKELSREHYDAAIVALQNAVKENPRDAAAIRDLGIAHFKKNDLARAQNFLGAAQTLIPQDGVTLFYLGAIQEQQGNVDAAIKVYSQYPAATGNQARAAMRARLAQLVRERLQEEARDALANESQATLAPPKNSVAVMYFRNLGANRELDPLQKGLADMLITDLSQIKALRVVERARLQSLLDEMGLGMSGLVDEATAPRVGRLLGVEGLVNGAFLDLAGKQLRVDAGLAQAQGEALTPESLNGPLEKFFRLEKDLTFKLLDRMGMQPTPQERDAILRIPTENLLAFLAYCKGLDYEDRGDYKQAEKSYSSAARIDPQFQQAKQRVARVQALQAFPPALSGAEQLVSRAPDARLGAGPAPNLASRLLLTSINTGTHLRPPTAVADTRVRSNDPRQPAIEGTGVFGDAAEIQISVPLP